MTELPATLRIRRPDDWHLHFRDGEITKTVLPFTSQLFARAIVMPNLVPPITTVEAAIAYRERIIAATPKDHDFTPLMVCYLNQSVTREALEQGFSQGVFTAAKLYPANATTNSQHGVSCIEDVFPLLEVMQRIGMPLLIHGEVTRAEIDIFDREKYFIDEVLTVIRHNFPELKVVCEHITTKEAAQYVLEGNHYLGATLTPQHLAQNRNDMLVGGIRPHLYCLPILKRREHQEALRAAVASGHPRLFLGTDSAPHVTQAKETSCGCAGVFNAEAAISVYADVFAEENALEYFEAFCSENGPRFYGLPLNESYVTLTRKPTPVAERVGSGENSFVPYKAGEMLTWQALRD